MNTFILTNGFDFPGTKTTSSGAFWRLTGETRTVLGAKHLLFHLLLLPAGFYLASP